MQTQELPRRGSLRPSDAASDSSRSSHNASTPGARGRASHGKNSESEITRSFLSDSGRGHSSMDSRPSSLLGDDTGSVRKQVPNMFQFRPQSASMGKSERSSKASTSSSTEDMIAHEDNDDEIETENSYAQILSDSILSQTTVELDLGIGKYKDTYMPAQAQTAEVIEIEEDGDFTNMQPQAMKAEVVELEDDGDFTVTEMQAQTIEMHAQTIEMVELEEDGDFTNVGDFTKVVDFASGHGRGSVQIHRPRKSAPTPTSLEIEVASFLTAEENSIDMHSGDVSDSDSDTSNFLTVDENSRIVRSSTVSEMTSRRAPPPMPTDVAEPLPVIEALIVEEIMPENSSGEPLSSGGEQRNPEAVLEDDDVPVVIRKVAKKMLGHGGRRSREKRPVNPKVQEVVSGSIAESEAAAAAKEKENTSLEATDEPSAEPSAEPPKPAQPTIQLSDLQVHLDRMNEISASLRHLRSDMAASTAHGPSTAMAALESFETKAKADAAAKIAAGFVSAFERSRGLADRASLSASMLSAAAPPVQPVAQVFPRTSLFNLKFAMGDGSFREFLIDSSFVDTSENPDGSGIGWVTVTSRTTGKVYYYNESCGLTSWTLPGPDTYRGAIYMVL